MQFKKLSKRGYLGILVTVLSCLFLLTQFGLPFLSNQDLFRQDFESAIVVSGIGFVIGIYLITGPLGALISMIPLATAIGGGCAGCAGGGGGGGEKPSPDLGEPPAPPSSSTAGHIFP